MPEHLTASQDHSYHRDYCECPECQEWADRLEARHALDMLAAMDAEVRQAKPATDQEWAEFMDAEFPRAKEGVA